MEEQFAAKKRVDRRVLRTRKAIMSAFDKLVCNGSIDKITVSAIAREADIDRKTFYLHYKSVGDLVSRKTEAALEHIVDVVKEAGENTTPLQRVHIVLEEVNKLLMENLAVYSNLASSLSTDQVFEHFAQAAEPVMLYAGLDPEAQADERGLMLLQFYVSGALSLYITWLKSDHSQPIATVSDVIEESVVAIHLHYPQISLSA